MSHARDSLDDILPRVQVLRLGFDDRDAMLFDIVQEGTLKRLSMALDLDLSARAAELAAAERRGAVKALRNLSDRAEVIGQAALDEMDIPLWIDAIADEMESTT